MIIWPWTTYWLNVAKNRFIGCLWKLTNKNKVSVSNYLWTTEINFMFFINSNKKKKKQHVYEVWNIINGSFHFRDILFSGVLLIYYPSSPKLVLKLNNFHSQNISIYYQNTSGLKTKTLDNEFVSPEIDICESV